MLLHAFGMGISAGILYYFLTRIMHIRHYVHPTGMDHWIPVAIREHFAIGLMIILIIGLSYTFQVREAKRRKLVGQLLYEQLHLLNELIVAIPTPFVYTDAEGVCRGCNTAFEQVVGKPREQVMGLKLDALLNPEELTPVHHTPTPQSEHSSVYEATLQYADGTTHDILYYRTTFLDTTGKESGTVVNLQDVTAYKEAENILRESEQRMRMVVQNLPIMVDALDENDRLIMWNRECERVTGYTAEEILGNPRAFELLYPDKEYREQLWPIFEKLRGGFRDIEMTLTCKDGSQRIISWSNVAQEHPIPGWGTWEVGVDITERKLAEEALRESEARNRALLKAIPDLIFVVDQDGIFVDYELDAATDLFLPPEQFIGRSIVDVMPQPIGEEALSYIRQALQTGSLQHYEYQLIHGHATHARDYEARMTRSGDSQVLILVRNITERKWTEELLRIQRDLALSISAPHDLKMVLDQVLQAIFEITDLDCGWVYLPDEQDTYRLVTQSGLNGEFVQQIARLDSNSPLEQLLVEQKPYYGSGETFFPQGLCKQVTFQGLAIIPVQYESRTVAVLVLVSQHEVHITEREQHVLEIISAQIGGVIAQIRAEQALTESEKRYRTISELTSDFAYAFRVHEDHTMECEWITGAVRRITGYATDEVKARNGWDHLVYLEDRHFYQRHLQDLRKGKSSVLEYRIVTKNKSTRWIRDHGITEWNESHTRVTHIYGAVQDVTAWKLAEIERVRLLSRLREQTQRMQHIIDTVPEGVLLVNASGKILLTNPVAERDLKMLAGELAKQGVLTHLGNRPFKELLSPPPHGMWHEVQTTTPVPRYYHITARKLNSEGHIDEWVMVTHDVTQERDISLRVQQQERLAAVGQLAAGIAHDFNNIMATIVLYAQMTERTPGLPPQGQKRLRTITRQAWQATNLIQQILDFSRRSIIERKPLPLLPLVKEQVKLLQHTLPESIEVQLDYGHDDYVINADPTRIQQVLMNLALNARDAMPDGGKLKIALERIPGEAYRIVSRTGSGEKEPVPAWVKLTVTDTGTGIQPEHIPHIFEPFFTTKEPGKGSGLGLAQVYGIVMSHDGDIRVTSRLNQGTTFTLYFPAMAENKTEEHTNTPPPLKYGQGETILVVEDDAATRTVLTESLRLLNYQVLSAPNGQVALSILEQQDPKVDLVLSDVVMPVMGGIALLHKLQERHLADKVILLTGHPLKEKLEDLHAPILITWMLKPPPLELLAKTVANALHPQEEK